MKIGFIGLGIMGKPMAKNLMKGGYTDVVVNDLNKDAVKELVDCGASAAENDEIGKLCDVVFTMLPNSPQVKEVMLGGWIIRASLISLLLPLFPSLSLFFPFTQV